MSYIIPNLPTRSSVPIGRVIAEFEEEDLEEFLFFGQRLFFGTGIEEAGLRVGFSERRAAPVTKSRPIYRVGLILSGNQVGYLSKPLEKSTEIGDFVMNLRLFSVKQGRICASKLKYVEVDTYLRGVMTWA